MVDLNALAEQLVNLTVKQSNELAAILEKEYNIKPAAAPVMVASAPAASVEEKAEKTEFDLILKSVGAGVKLKVIKLLKEKLIDLGMQVSLTEAKELVEKAPNIIQEKLPKEKAELLKKDLEEAGAEVELK